MPLVSASGRTPLPDSDTQVWQDCDGCASRRGAGRGRHGRDRCERRHVRQARRSWQRWPAADIGVVAIGEHPLGRCPFCRRILRLRELQSGLRIAVPRRSAGGGNATAADSCNRRYSQLAFTDRADRLAQPAGLGGRGPGTLCARRIRQPSHLPGLVRRGSLQVDQ